VEPEKGSDLRAYYARKRTMALWSIGVAVVAGLALAPLSPIAAIAEVFGTFCGIANALLTMRGNERLADHRRVGAFVLSSVLRIAVFGIVPVEFALHGPWWSMATYFFGFFTPLAVYALIVARKLHPDSNL
jgi:hypothetical protein